jgi:hypothetical protein
MAKSLMIQLQERDEAAIPLSRATQTFVGLESAAVRRERSLDACAAHTEDVIGSNIKRKN